MALTERERDYEILIRINEDGSLGAHFRSITEILRDGDVVSAVENPPVPLATAIGQEGASLADKLGSVASAALLQNDSLQRDLIAAGQQIESLNTQHQEAQSEIARLTALLNNEAATSQS
jgi:hypothetical protein